MSAPFGKFRLKLESGAGLFISKVSAEGAPFQDGVLDVAEGMSIRLDIVASDEVGRLKGFVKKGDNPVPEVLAVLAPRAGSSNPFEYFVYETDSDGSFDISNIPAGDYVLFAVADPYFEYANPEVVKPYFPSGKAVHVNSHSVSNEQVSGSAPPDR